MRNSWPYILPIFLLTMLYARSGSAQEVQQKIPEKTRLLFLLDASGSMLAKWENSVRMTVAKQLLSDLADSLQVNPNLDLALRVYGHQFHRRFNNCQDSKLEVPFKSGNHEQIKAKLQDIKPQGNTPIAYSLEQAANDFPAANNVRNIVIVITDGLESCGGDPCDISQALQAKGIFLKPFIIGLGSDKRFEEQFECAGQYFDAKDTKTFRLALNKALKQSLNKTTVSLELLDEEGAPRESNVNTTFINTVTQSPMYNFVHFRDKQGRPDTVEIDGVLTYDLQVNTMPPVIRRSIPLEGGEHNVITIPVPQGALNISMPGHTEYRKGVDVIVRKLNSPQVVNLYKLPRQDRYLEGNYDLEVLTFPKINFRNVAITGGQETTLSIPNPGIVNISTGVRGYGSIYQIDDDGRQTWLANLEQNQMKQSLTIQPGVYCIVYRAQNAFGSKYTEVKTFTITPGSTMSVKLFNK